MTHSAIHAEPNETSTIIYNVNFGNVLWLLLIGWWFAILYLIVGVMLLSVGLTGTLMKMFLVHICRSPFSKVSYIDPEYMTIYFTLFDGRKRKRTWSQFFSGIWSWILCSSSTLSSDNEPLLNQQQDDLENYLATSWRPVKSLSLYCWYIANEIERLNEYSKVYISNSCEKDNY
jgi:hypothetical protein